MDSYKQISMGIGAEDYVSLAKQIRKDLKKSGKIENFLNA